MPLSEEALQFARRLAAKKYTYPDDRLALSLLLARWNLDLGNSLAERRMALRLAREQLSDELPGPRERAVVQLHLGRPRADPASPAPGALAGIRRPPGTRDRRRPRRRPRRELDEELDFYATALKDADED